MAKFLQNKRLIGASFVLIALITLIIYILTSLDAGQGNLLMPLDDVYIHFQYARQFATGHPYQYNLIDPPTSGATSLLYPYLLAFGYVIGFKGLWLGLWAMLLGTVALIASQWAIYRLCIAMTVPNGLSLLTALGFGLTGSFSWHFMSGMETGIVIALLLWTLLLVIEKKLFSFVIVATLLTVMRPEGGLVATIASGTMFLRLWVEYSAQEKKPSRRIYLLLLAVPILALGLQPLVNLLITGTTVATGAQAKSILSTVPQDYGLIFRRIWDNFSRMWIEFITGYDIREGRGWYLPIFTGVLGLGAIPMLILKKNYRLIGFMLLGWLLILTLAISTLDNAFWHFKRYQMPMLALFYPLSAWFLAEMLHRFPKMRYPIYGFSSIVFPIFAIILFIQFQQYHAKNVSYVYQQPYQMGLWLQDNTPEDALVAVHDVGLMRYIGERNTLDMVGLTTPNAASYWRNGPGSVAEFLLNERPDYIASYGRGHGYGLAFLADTSLYANQLADFTVDNWQPYLNVALAAQSQGIYQPDWNEIAFAEGTVYSWYVTTTEVIAEIDVANIDSEIEYHYDWHSENQLGFASEVQQFGELDSYRLVDDYETFVFEIQETQDYPLILISRVHASASGTLDIYVNESFIDTQWIPDARGMWLDLNTEIPVELLSETSNTILIVPNVPNGYYMPSHHVVVPQNETTTRRLEIMAGDDFIVPASIANYQNETFSLTDFEVWFTDRMNVSFDFYVADDTPQGDYRFFVHLYDDVNAPPVTQWDGYVQDYPEFNQVGMPVGNWLADTLEDSMSLPITDIPAGTYQLAIGFYNPNNPTDRLIPESDIYDITDDGRLWLGEVEIE